MKFALCKYIICFIVQIILIFPFASMHRVREWQLTCPVSSQWNLRARGFCNITNPHYYCLYDVNVLHYKEFCRAKDDFHKPGNKYIIRGDIDGEPCNKNRYQPFKFKTDGNNKCIFQKSFCNEKGQIVHNIGSTTVDTSCRCDYTEGYNFVIEPTNKCYCHPLQEDCSCYKKKCNSSEFLKPNYECGTDLLGEYACRKIKTNSLNKNRTVSSAVPSKPTMDPSYLLDLTGYKVHVNTAKLIILIVVLFMSIVVILFITYGLQLIEKCNTFLHMDEIISEKVNRGIAKYEQHSYISQDASHSLMQYDNEELRRGKIRDIHNNHIYCWEKEDDMFVETKATRIINEKLKTDSCVLVVGCAGNGKSSIIRHIALKLRKEAKYEIIPIVLSPCNIFECIDTKQNQIFIVDDLCGKGIINVQSVSVWLSQMVEILKLINTSGKNGRKDVKFLLATESNIYEDSIFKKLKFLMKYVFNLSKCHLTENEKREMIEKYVSVEAQTILPQHINVDQAYFPLVCKIAERKSKDQVHKLFTDFEDFIKQDIIATRIKHNLKFCVITLCALLDNNLTETILDGIYESAFEMQAFESICSEFNLGPNKDIIKSKIKEQLENIEDIYIAKTENNYHFIHTKIYQIAVLVCGKNCLHIFIKFVRSSIFAELFCFQSNRPEKDTHIIIIEDEDAEKRYFDRLLFDLKKGDTYSTFHNRQLCSKSYREKFLFYCQKRKQNVIELLKKISVNNETVGITCAENEYEDYTEFTEQHHFISHKMRKPLIESAMEGHADIVQLLLEFECDINEVDRFGRTALFVACLLGKKDVVNVLIDNHADILMSDVNGQSPLLVASRARYNDIVKTLLHHNADVNQYDVNGDTPLLVASAKCQLSTVQILSRKKTDISKRNNLGQTPVFVASMNGREDVVKHLLTFLGEYISTPDNEDRSPLFIACKEGYQNVVELLLKHEADVSHSDWNGRSPLFIASAEGHTDIVTTLIKNKANINMRDDEGMTPLFIACDKGRLDIAKILINSNADLNVKDNENRSPLYTACRRGFPKIVKLLFENNGSILECNKWKGSPLFAACRQGHFEIVKYLVENGASISSQDINGTTPLIVASENGNTQIGQLLIDHGCDINQYDNDKKTPLHVAAVGGHATMVEVLMKAGALTNVDDKKGKTPLDLARKYDSTDIVRLLSSDN